MGGRIGLGVEAVGRIDEGGALAVLASHGEQLAEEQVAAAAGAGAGELGQRGARQSAAGGFINGGDACSQPGALRAGGAGKAFGDEKPKRSHFFGCSRQRERRV